MTTNLMNPISPHTPAFDSGAEFELVIQPRRGWIGLDWADLWRQRELLGFLVWRDIKVRYKQTVLGASWAVIQPLFNMVIFTLFFGNLAGFKEDLPAGLPYFIWNFAGLVPWFVISTGIGAGGLSLINQQHLLTKIYFPRLYVPSAVIGGALLDMAISSVVLAGMILAFGVDVAPTAWLVAPLLIPIVLAALGMAYLLSAMTVTYRDVRFIIPFMTQALQYLSFVMIPMVSMTKRLPERLHWIEWPLSLNPAFGLLDGCRSALFGLPWRPANLAISILSSLLLFVGGAMVFRRTERRFADIA